MKKQGYFCLFLPFFPGNFTFILEMSKWVSTREPIRLTTGSSQVGLRKKSTFSKVG